MTIVASDRDGQETPTTLPSDLVFMEVLHDLLRLFITEEEIQRFLKSLGVHFASCVVDTNIWLQDITRTLKKGAPSGLLQAARIGTLRLYASTVVRAEVPEKIDEHAKDLKIDPGQAHHLWETSYLPLIHFLDPSHLSPPHVQVVVNDPDDAPTGQLIELLRPSIVLSLDKKHLEDFGIVSDPKTWTMFPAAWRDHAERDALVVGLYLGGGMTVFLSWEVIRGIVAAIARLDKRLLLALAVVLGAAIIFPPTRRMLQRLLQFLATFAQSELVRDGFQYLATQIVTKTTQAAEAKQFLLEQERPILRPTRVLDYLVFVLSRAEGTLSVKELTRRIIDLGYEPRGEHPERYVRRLLGASPGWFEQDDAGCWRLTRGDLNVSSDNLQQETS